MSKTCSVIDQHAILLHEQKCKPGSVTLCRSTERSHDLNTTLTNYHCFPDPMFLCNVWDYLKDGRPKLTDRSQIEQTHSGSPKLYLNPQEFNSLSFKQSPVWACNFSTNTEDKSQMWDMQCWYAAFYLGYLLAQPGWNMCVWLGLGWSSSSAT